MRVQSQFIEMYRRAHKEMTLESVCTIMGKGITPKYVDSSSVVVINQACVHWDGQHLENVKYHNKNVPVKKRTLETGDVLLPQEMELLADAAYSAVHQMKINMSMMVM